jgi:hypothetical protein
MTLRLFLKSLTVPALLLFSAHGLWGDQTAAPREVARHAGWAPADARIAGPRARSAEGVPPEVLSALRSGRFVFDTLLDHSGSRWAVGAHRGARTNRYLVALDMTGGTGRILRKPIPLADFEPYPSAKWFSYSGNTPDGLVYAFDAAAEGVAGARVFQVRDAALHSTFDDRPTTCKPAEIRREGGHTLLLVYTDYIEQSDCEADCSVLIREDVGVEPAWINVLEWGGAGWRPLSIKAPTLSPTLYRTMADGYRKAALFTTSKKGHRCSSAGDSRKRQLETWALRAEQLAK